LVALVGFVLPENPVFGIGTENAINIRTIFLFAAAWILVFTIPLLIWVPEIPKQPGEAKESIAKSYKALFRRLETLYREAPETFKFLVSSAVYRDGLSGVFTFGAILGTLAFGFDTTSIIFYGIGANVIAAIGAAIGGRLDDIIGSKAVILGSLVGLIVSAVALFALRDFGQITYWIFGLLLTLFVGPAQASSRTFISRFTPHGREGEVFGLYQTTGRLISILSPTLWGLSIGMANIILGGTSNTIYGIWGILVVLLAGAILLTRVAAKPEILGTVQANELQRVRPQYIPNEGARYSTLSILAIIFAFFIPGLGLLLGYHARKEILNSKGQLDGLALSLVAKFLGWIWVFFFGTITVFAAVIMISG
jgi:UMF1 family MFS transporter